MHPEIEKLIQLAIAEGEITEKNRSIILNKAEKLGEEKDEVELIMDGELALLRKEHLLDLQSQVELNEEEIINKCSTCGANVSYFTTKCSSCGGKILKKESSSIKQLLIELSEIEKEKDQLLTKDGFWGPPHYIENLTAIENKKAMIISFFPIPNTKEEILNFLSKAIPKTKTKTVFQLFDGTQRNLHNICAKAWKMKCKEIIIMARFSIQQDKKALEKIESYAQQLQIR